MKKLRPRVIKNPDMGLGIHTQASGYGATHLAFKNLYQMLLSCSEPFISFSPHLEEKNSPLLHPPSCSVISTPSSLWLQLFQSPTHSPLATTASLVPPLGEVYSDLTPFAQLLLLPEPICPHVFAWLTSLPHSSLSSNDIQRLL